MKQTAKLLVSKEMLPFLPQQIWGGCSICYWSTMLIPIMTLQQGDDGRTDKEHLQYGLYGMVAFGVGECVGGLFHGLLIDKIGSRRTIWANLIILIFVFGVTEWSVYRN